MISEQQLIIKRLEGLERYNRHLTRVGSTMLILLGAVFVMAQVSPKRTVEAQVVLLNDNGNVVGKLTSKPKVQLVLTDTYKSEVASLDAHGVDFKNEASGTSCGVWAFGLLGSYHTKEGSGGVELSNSDNPHLLMTGTCIGAVPGRCRTEGNTLDCGFRIAGSGLQPAIPDPKWEGGVRRVRPAAQLREVRPGRPSTFGLSDQDNGERKIRFRASTRRFRFGFRFQRPVPRLCFPKDGGSSRGGYSEI